MAEEKLHVRLSAANHKPGRLYPNPGLFDLSLGWRVAWGIPESDETARLLLMRFERKRDAEAALAALTKCGVSDPLAVYRLGVQRIHEIMAEAMAW